MPCVRQHPPSDSFFLPLPVPAFSLSCLGFFSFLSLSSSFSLSLTLSYLCVVIVLCVTCRCPSVLLVLVPLCSLSSVQTGMGNLIQCCCFFFCSAMWQLSLSPCVHCHGSVWPYVASVPFLYFCFVL